MKKSTWQLVLLLLLHATHCVGQKFSILGKFEEDCNLDYVNLYQFNNMFDHPIVEKISIINKSFEVKRNLEEINVFFIENPIDKKFIVFIWDGDITINVNCINLHQSQVINSPYTSELKNLDSQIQLLIVNPVKKIEALIEECNNKYNSTDANECHKLRASRDSLIDSQKNKLAEYELNYVKKHPSSFVSLFYLTKTGLEASESDYLEAYKFLSEDLKKHSRSAVYKTNK